VEHFEAGSLRESRGKRKKENDENVSGAVKQPLGRKVNESVLAEAPTGRGRGPTGGGDMETAEKAKEDKTLQKPGVRGYKINRMFRKRGGHKAEGKVGSFGEANRSKKKRHRE